MAEQSLNPSGPGYDQQLGQGGWFPIVDDTTKKPQIITPQGPLDVDPATGYAITPQGPVRPFWGYDPKTGAPIPPGGAAASPGQPTPQPVAKGVSNQTNLPAANIQPGLSSQQWEATYTLQLATEKRLRELMETIQQPQARQLIDQAIQLIKQQGYQNEVGAGQQKYQNEVGAYEGQMKSSGNFPQWLPNMPAPVPPPTFQPGAWKAYQPATPGGVGVGAGMTEEQAAQAIWDKTPQLQQMYKNEHPDMDPVTAVKDWWGFAPHEGAATLADYAKMKGWIPAAVA